MVSIRTISPNTKDSGIIGKGNQVWRKTGAVYDGDWKDDKRHGYGVYSVMRKGALVKEYAGGWKNDKKHVSDSVTC